MRSNPIIRIRQLDSFPLQGGPNPGIDHCRAFIGRQTFESEKEFLNFQQRTWTDVGLKLAIEKFSYNMQAR